MTSRVWRTSITLMFAIQATAWFGCAGTMGGMSLDEVSDVPIAFVYWEPEAARRRQEIIDQATSGRPVGMPTRTGIATGEGIATLFGRDPASAEGLQRFPGHVAFLNARTGEITRFQGSPANARPLAWSDDRNTLLFSSAHKGIEGFQLYEFDLEEGELRGLTRGPAMYLEGDYAPDGRIAMSFVDARPDKNVAGMLVADSHGAHPVPLVDASYASSPRFSPDGEHIVYVRSVNRPQRTGQVRDASTIVAQQVEFGADVVALARGREPSFSPDGEVMVYTSETIDGWKLHRMRIDGGARARLGGSIRDERNPAVSPDGRHVVYVSPGDDGIDRLYIRRIDGSGDRILLGEGSAAWPVW